MVAARFVGGTLNADGKLSWSNNGNWLTGQPATLQDVSVAYSFSANHEAVVDQNYTIGALAITAEPLHVLSTVNLVVTGGLSGTGSASLSVGGGGTASVTGDDSGVAVDVFGQASFSGSLRGFSSFQVGAVDVLQGGSLSVAGGIYGTSVTLLGGTLDVRGMQATDPAGTAAAASIGFAGVNNHLSLAGGAVQGTTYTGGTVTGITLGAGDTLSISNALIQSVNSVQYHGNGTSGELFASGFVGNTFTTFTMAVGTNNLQDFGSYPVSGGTISFACYAERTRIATPEGERAIETLLPGDAVTLADGSCAPVLWIGRRALDLGEVPAARPVRIRVDAFGPGLPRRDLVVSPDHAILVDDVLIPAKRLLNGRTVALDGAAERVVYYHLELAAHGIVLAEGLPAESWLDTGNRDLFENADVTVLRPGFNRSAPECWTEDACAPLVEDGPCLAAVRARLAALAAALEQVGLDVDVGSVGTTRIEVPAGVETLHLLSASKGPGHDRRRLGALVTAVRLDGTALPVSDTRLGHGFHPVEMHGSVAVRWTDGAGVLSLGRSGTNRTVHIDVAAVSRAVADRQRAGVQDERFQDRNFSGWHARRTSEPIERPPLRT